jgi:hypothetical protein
LNACVGLFEPVFFLLLLLLMLLLLLLLFSTFNGIAGGMCQQLALGNDRSHATQSSDNMVYTLENKPRIAWGNHTRHSHQSIVSLVSCTNSYHPKTLAERNHSWEPLLLVSLLEGSCTALWI